VAFSPDGKSLIAGGANFLTEWSVATGRMGRSYPVGASYTYSIAFSPDGKSMATGGTRTVGLWDLASGKPKFEFSGHQGEVDTLLFSADGKELITGGYDKPIIRWDLATSKEIARLTAPTNWTNLLIPSPDGKTLLTQGDNLALIVLDAATGKECVRFVKHLPPRVSGHSPMNAVYMPDGKSVISYAQAIDPNVRIWEAETGKETLVIPVNVGKPQGDGLIAMAVSPDVKTLYTANRLGAARVWDTATGKELRQIDIKEKNTRPLTFSSDGRSLAGILGNAIAVWDTTSGKQIRSIPCPRGFPTRMSFTSDGRTLVVTHVEGSVSLLEIATGQSRLEVSGHAGPVKGFAFSPDGRLFATGSDDTTALVWDLRALALARSPAVAELTPKTLDTLWTDLSGDAPTAYKAVARLSGFPKESVAFLGSRLGPVETKQLDKLIAKLDDDDFDTRESATNELIGLGAAAEPALRKALAGAPSAEARVRLENILALLVKGAETNKNRLGLMRALEVLETIGTPEAQKLVESLAKGAELAEQTVEAKATLARMERKARRD
jgi:WD40 repeat protein